MTSEMNSLESKLFNTLLEMYESSVKHELRQLYTLDRGKTIFQEGATPKGIYFIKSGRVKIVKHNDGIRPMMYRIANSGEFIGFVSLINETPYPTRAIALEKTQVWFIARTIFFKTLKEDISFANGFVHMLCKRLNYAEDYIDDLKIKDVRQRLATTLLSLAAPLIKKGAESLFIDIMRKDLAHIVSTTPETLSRQLKSFEEEKAIRLSRKKIFIESPGKLLIISNVSD